MKLVLPAILLCLLSCNQIQESPFEADLKRIDETIAKADEYVREKQSKINMIENMLQTPGLTAIQEYHIYGNLYDEYVAYQFDKAKSALDNQILLAEKLGERTLKDDALLDKTHLFIAAGYYHEAAEVFKQIDTTKLNQQQMVEWYMSRQKFLSDYDEYVSIAGFVVPDTDRIAHYQKRVVESQPQGSYYSRHIEIISLIDQQKYREAYDLNVSLLETLDKNTRNYAVQTYWHGVIFDGLDDIYNAIHWWTESVICDIRAAIKDNASLATLASRLIDPQDAERAFKYLRFSLDDADFYNGKLRKVQIATSFPTIEKAYTDSITRQERERNMYLVFISAIAMLLAFFCILTFRMYAKNRAIAEDVREKNDKLLLYTRSIEDAEETLHKANLDLMEANTAKEEYLGLFLSMCSGYLDKLKKALPREQYDAELKNFYKTFDTSFLQLYPSFVEEFNALLKEDCRIVLKDGESLNTELRIFALIKLGITQSSHIASLLRYSVNTIYNYRAQVKNSVLAEREDFEALVRRIGSKY